MRQDIRPGFNVEVLLFGPDGRLKARRETHNMLVNTGCKHIADALASSQDETAMGYMAIGTGTTDETEDDTALETELDRNLLTSRLQGSGAVEHQTLYTGDWAAGDGTGSITEAGIFNDASAGTMLTRATFDAIEKAAGDSLRIIWKLSFLASS